MDIAALILSILALLMSGATLIVYLSTYIFSKREIQYVPVGDGPASPKGRPIAESFEEFSYDGPMDAALKKAPSGAPVDR